VCIYEPQSGYRGDDSNKKKIYPGMVGLCQSSRIDVVAGRLATFGGRNQLEYLFHVRLGTGTTDQNSQKRGKTKFFPIHRKGLCTRSRRSK